jgi:hypothetical protein
MALRMVSLKNRKTGEWVARKGIPADVRADYKRLYGVGREVILRVPAGTSKAQAKARLGQWQAEDSGRENLPVKIVASSLSSQRVGAHCSFPR